MHKFVTNWRCALAVAAALAGPAAAHDKTPVTVSPLITVPQIAPALASHATVPVIAPVVPQQGAIPATAKFVPDVAGPAAKNAELPQFDATPKMVGISRPGVRSGHDGRAALEPGAMKRVTAKSEASAATADADTSAKSDTKVAANTNSNTEAAVATQPAASQVAPAPAPSCR